MPTLAHRFPLHARAALLVVACLLACESPPRAASSVAFAPSAWTVDSAPTLVLGDASGDTTKLFATVIGATRLPDGKIMVADRQDEYNLHIYDGRGVWLRSFGRRGTGPGEFSYAARFWRCGDTVYVYDIDGYRETALTLGGAFVRSFHFGRGAQAPGSQTPYRSVCNRSATFAHYGWDRTRPALKEGEIKVTRGKVPFWLSGADSMVRAALDSFPGSERAVHAGGSTPRKFGKQTSIAIASDRLYVGTAERAEVFVISLMDYSTDTIPVPVTPGAVTAADIETLKATQTATEPADRRASMEREFATHPFPDSLPPYAALVVDAEEVLWVQDYPRAGSEFVKWSIVSRDGSPVATVTLPAYLEVYEIGTDYILGRYLHPVESIPQVRQYRLRRGAVALTPK